jgi:hypothetical protein
MLLPIEGAQSLIGSLRKRQQGDVTGDATQRSPSLSRGARRAPVNDSRLESISFVWGAGGSHEARRRTTRFRVDEGGPFRRVRESVRGVLVPFDRMVRRFVGVRRPPARRLSTHRSTARTSRAGRTARGHFDGGSRPPGRWRRRRRSVRGSGSRRGRLRRRGRRGRAWSRWLSWLAVGGRSGAPAVTYRPRHDRLMNHDHRCRSFPSVPA